MCFLFQPIPGRTRGGPVETDFLSPISVRSSTATFPANGFVLDALVLYDDNYLNTRHSGNTANVQTEINAIWALAQNFYNLKDTLGTTIQINLKETRHLSGSYTASGANVQ